MIPGKAGLDAGAWTEVSALIQRLHETGQRLEELTSGEVDTVADGEGRTFMLRTSQEQLRYIEATKQAALLNALPAHIALLDPRGVIISVNEGWRQFDAGNSLESPGYAIGVNYLEVCAGARGDDAFGARQVAAGIRGVLDSTADSFSIEYACHSPSHETWFLLMVTPLDHGQPHGAVVMHLDVTAERQAKEGLRMSELRFRQIAENIREVFWLTDPAKNQILYVSPAYAEIWGRSCESVYARPRDWIDAIHPDDRERVMQAAQTLQASGKYAEEFRVVRPDGSIRWIRDRAFPVFRNEGDGEIYRIAGVAEDITERKQASDELRESERRFSDMLANVEMVSLMLDTQGRVTYCNDYLVRLTGWPREEVIGRDWLERFVPPDASGMKDTFAALLANAPEAWHQENEILTRSGERRLIRWNNSVLKAGASVIGTASLGEDITEQKRAEIRIERLNRVYAMLSQINALIVRVASREELFGEACRIAVDVGGFKMAWVGVIDPQTLDGKVVAWHGGAKGYIDIVRLTAREGALDSERPACRALRESQPVIANDIANDPSLVAIRDELVRRGHRSLGSFPLTIADRPEAVITFYAGEPGAFDAEEARLLGELAGNISFALDHLEKGERLDYLAYYDALTGLANRGLFLERVAQYIRGAAGSGHKLALYLIDLERFRNINDSLGRPAGDALLKQVAEWLTRNLGDANLLARVGSDHFAVVLPEVGHADDVGGWVEKTIAGFLEHPFRLNDAVFRIAVKIGVALFPDDGASADIVFKNAEAALKKAKASGDRYLFYTQTMTETVAGKLTMENQLRQALEQEEFVLHYQPKVSLATGKVTGAEALLRWNDPRTGLVPPGRFIPILEETGLIYDVGRWALRKALDDYLRWRRAGLPAVRIAVNVSALQLRHRGFIAEIEQAIGVDALAAAGLELEITESMIMEDVKHVIASLQTIRASGVSIAIDDFGTGFSSLAYLSRLPVDTLKIDRSFVIDMTAGPQGLSLVSTIINLAHSLNLKVVAEGVETEEQSRLLRLLNCEEMQGFLFSKPVPAETFEALFLAPPPREAAR
jgi:diguanylate cyclase (GGDEF)-like protein/PAS domain S-box-containing protein